MPGPRGKALAALAVLAVLAQQAHCWAVELTNIRHDDPLAFVPWDEARNEPTQVWQGSYTHTERLSCELTTDLLFDWPDLKRSMSLWLEATVRKYHNVTQIYWERIRPIQHALTNIISLHEVMTSRDCILGILAIRFFYLIVQTRSYRESTLVSHNSMTTDWYYIVSKFNWSILVDTGWAPIFFSILAMLSQDFKKSHPDSVWMDCEELPHIGPLSTDMEAYISQDHETWHVFLEGLAQADEESLKRCPCAYAYVAALLATAQEDEKLARKFLDVSQYALRHFREENNFTLANVLLSKWEIFPVLAHATFVLDMPSGSSQKKSCEVLWCPEGGTPNTLTCRCETIFSQEFRNVSACLFVVDTRRRSSLRNITSILNARYWTLAYGINRAYAQDHGFEIDYVQPDSEIHYPERKVGWAKVKVLIDALRERGPERCAYGVSLDSDAFMRTSESLSAIIADYGLDQEKLIMFSQEYHVEQSEQTSSDIFINGGFFIVRNTPEAVQLLQEWYDVPETYEDMAHLKKDNPQGLNLCWDSRMQPKYASVTVLARALGCDMPASRGRCRGRAASLYCAFGNGSPTQLVQGPAVRAGNARHLVAATATKIQLHCVPECVRLG
ncbi:unnamed protein product [Effrenium voratum]|uniref:Nucleotide-diphospho-sugar transferase domain-containing protein n=1 Tax=Effrenium voratum TaxID=2562239 RepID=A0AA36MPK9_9DINO|nr:unnamed protein product [Effrenium voratum]